MTGKDERRHVKVGTDLRKTTGTESAHERTNAEPETKDLTEAEEVWKEAETTPTRDGEEEVASGGERVADAGDVGAGQASPYGTEAQADAIARQTERTDEPRDVKKPKRR